MQDAASQPLGDRIAHRAFVMHRTKHSQRDGHLSSLFVARRIPLMARTLAAAAAAACICSNFLMKFVK
ncbi:hypothetical protein CAL15_01780 [Bordetella genomosp. 13]|uniref:Uncharacterized protein n=1 Tax=Bordetella genomosp. 13 TaxID=463040 RepID=A0A1W6Z8R6_9BORD|nr:hypothetical protein CAL15_01780 [Bordetella genomosp. 13]